MVPGWVPFIIRAGEGIRWMGAGISTLSALILYIIVG